jgi:hypothetical protein
MVGLKTEATPAEKNTKISFTGKSKAWLNLIGFQV